MPRPDWEDGADDGLFIAVQKDGIESAKRPLYQATSELILRYRQYSRLILKILSRLVSFTFHQHSHQPLAPFLVRHNLPSQASCHPM